MIANVAQRFFFCGELSNCAKINGPNIYNKLGFFSKKCPHFAKFRKNCQPDFYQISTICPIHSHNIEVFKKNYIVKSNLSPNLAKLTINDRKSGSIKNMEKKLRC
jgi:hypothetical protein